MNWNEFKDYDHNFAMKGCHSSISFILGSATGPHGHDPGLISRDDDKKALSGKYIIIF